MTHNLFLEPVGGHVSTRTTSCSTSLGQALRRWARRSLHRLSRWAARLESDDHCEHD